MMSQADIDAITISMLVNPTQKTSESIPPVRPSAADQKFYKKRITRILKGMLSGTIRSDELQDLHDSYVAGMITYLRAKDMSDALQSRYASVGPKSPDKATPPPCYKDPIRQPRATLSKFVKIRPKNPPVFPRTNPPFLKTEANRIKTDVFGDRQSPA